MGFVRDNGQFNGKVSLVSLSLGLLQNIPLGQSSQLVDTFESFS